MTGQTPKPPLVLTIYTERRPLECGIGLTVTEIEVALSLIFIVSLKASQAAVTKLTRMHDAGILTNIIRRKIYAAGYSTPRRQPHSQSLYPLGQINTGLGQKGIGENPSQPSLSLVPSASLQQFHVLLPLCLKFCPSFDRSTHALSALSPIILQPNVPWHVGVRREVVIATIRDFQRRIRMRIWWIYMSRAVSGRLAMDRDGYVNRGSFSGFWTAGSVSACSTLHTCSDLSRGLRNKRDTRTSRGLVI